MHLSLDSREPLASVVPLPPVAGIGWPDHHYHRLSLAAVYVMPPDMSLFGLRLHTWHITELQRALHRLSACQALA
jgi:hypothetical protein